VLMSCKGLVELIVLVRLPCLFSFTNH
jgi:hypothetical protein